MNAHVVNGLAFFVYALRYFPLRSRQVAGFDQRADALSYMENAAEYETPDVVFFCVEDNAVIAMEQGRVQR